MGFQFEEKSKGILRFREKFQRPGIKCAWIAFLVASSKYFLEAKFCPLPSQTLFFPRCLSMSHGLL